MKKTISIIAMAMLCLFYNAKAQPKLSNPTFKPVKTGERIPDLVINNIYNYKDTKTTLSDFKAKLIIIDFWATWCTSCLANFPEMEELQKLYGNEVQFLSVTYQPDTLVIPFLQKLYKGKPSLIPVVTNDKSLHELFPHRYIPHYVWIDQTGKVIATTSGEMITRENIDHYLSTSNSGDMRLKVDMDTSKPLFLTNELLKNNPVVHYSVFIKGGYDGLPGGFTAEKNKEGLQTGLVLSNKTIIDLYTHVMYALFEKRGQKYNESRRIFKVKDVSKLLKNDLRNTDFYTYACNTPDLKDSSLYEYVLNDLNRSTGFSGTIESVRVKCLVLRRTSKVDKIKTVGGKKQNLLFTAASRLVNYPISYLLLRITDLPFIKIPLIDETGYSANADLNLSLPSDLESLQKQLKLYDLELAEAVRKLDMFVLSNKNQVTL